MKRLAQTHLWKQFGSTVDGGDCVEVAAKRTHAAMNGSHALAGEQGTTKPWLERITDPSWRARRETYRRLGDILVGREDCADETRNECIGILPQILKERNEIAQIDAIQSTVEYFETVAGEECFAIAAEICEALVDRVLGGRAVNREKGEKLFAAVIHAGGVQEAIATYCDRGFASAIPKIVVSCVSSVELAVRTYGIEVVGKDKVLSRIATLFESKSAEVRSAAKSLVVELHRWIGNGIHDVLGELRTSIKKKLRETTDRTCSQASPVPERTPRFQRGASNPQDAVSTAALISEPVKPIPEGLQSLEIVENDGKVSWEAAIRSKNWSVRKVALETMIFQLGEESLDISGDCTAIFGALHDVFRDEKNVNVLAVAAMTVQTLAQNTLCSIPESCAEQMLMDLMNRLKEKHKSVGVSATDALVSLVLSGAISAASIEAALTGVGETKNSLVKLRVLNWLQRVAQSIQNSRILENCEKGLFKFACRAAEDASKDVRQAATELLAKLSLQMASAENLVETLEPRLQERVKKSVEIIKSTHDKPLPDEQNVKNREKLVEEKLTTFKENLTDNVLPSTSSASRRGNADRSQTETNPELPQKSESESMETKMPAIVSEMTQDEQHIQELVNRMESSDWRSRSDAVKSILKTEFLQTVGKISSECLYQLIAAVCDRAFDENRNTATEALLGISRIVQCKPSVLDTHLQSIGGVVLKALGDPNRSVRLTATKCLLRLFAISRSDYCSSALLLFATKTNAVGKRECLNCISQMLDKGIFLSDQSWVNLLTICAKCCEDESMSVQTLAKDVIRSITQSNEGLRIELIASSKETLKVAKVALARLAGESDGDLEASRKVQTEEPTQGMKQQDRASSSVAFLRRRDTEEALLVTKPQDSKIANSFLGKERDKRRKSQIVFEAGAEAVVPQSASQNTYPCSTIKEGNEDVLGDEKQVDHFPEIDDKQRATVLSSVETALMQKTPNARGKKLKELEFKTPYSIRPARPAKHSDASNFVQRLEDIKDRLQSDSPRVRVDGAKLLHVLLMERPVVTSAADGATALSDVTHNLTNVFTASFATALNDPTDDTSRELKYYLNGLLLIFDKAEMACTSRIETLTDIVLDLLERIPDDNSSQLDGGGRLWKGLRALLSRILENSNLTDLYHILLTWLGRNALGNAEGWNQSKHSYSSIELSVKCVMKLAEKGFRSVHMASLMRDVHVFLVMNSEYPEVASKVPEAKLPLRCVKSLLCEIVSFWGDLSIFLSLVPVETNPPILKYIEKFQRSRNSRFVHSWRKKISTSTPADAAD